MALADLKSGDQVYIIGVGGIGTSAIAQWLYQLGYKISGSDAVQSDITAKLEDIGIEITDAIPEKTKLVIYTDAAGSEHPIRQAAKSMNISELSYAQTLGQLSQKYTTIAITGSHGKSSTTAMTGLLLEELGLDPTVVVGTLVPQWQSDKSLGNFRMGSNFSPPAGGGVLSEAKGRGGSLLVVEADEYQNHFHELNPQIAVITSIDHDHVDAFPTKKDYLNAFNIFLNKIKPGGHLIIEETAHRQLKKIPHNLEIITYDKDLQLLKDNYIKLKVPGQHMLTNFAAAVSIALSVPPPKIEYESVVNAAKQISQTFTGTWRRFEEIGKFNKAKSFSDYAHHPTEVEALINATHEAYPNNRIVLVLQPHHHNRARAFADEFKQVLRDKLNSRDQPVLVEVYGVPGREEKTEAITTKDWAEELNCPYTTLENLKSTLDPIVKPEDILIFAGAGDIDVTAREIVS